MTNLANGKSVVVRVNDRGPFHRDRLIDLSYAAAVRIGIWPAGYRLASRYAPSGRATPPRRRHRPRARGGVNGRARLRPCIRPATGHRAPLRAGGRLRRARPTRSAAEALRRAGLGEVRVEDANVNGRRVRRVRLGPLSSADEPIAWLTPCVAWTGPAAGRGRLNACRFFATAQPPQSGAPEKDPMKAILPSLLSALLLVLPAANQAKHRPNPMPPRRPPAPKTG